jgi:hypothetical protein
VRQLREEREIETISGRRYQRLEQRSNYPADAEGAATVIQVSGLKNVLLGQ